jgi:NADP-dependent 3-hydroxy acid dehydrogenase YdfG
MPGKGKTVVVAGGSSASGVAVARAFSTSGFTVFTVGSNEERIKAAASRAGPDVIPLTCNLAELQAVQELCEAIRRQARGIDGVIHLVGGWRGADGIEDQSDDDWRFLEETAVTTLRNVTRVFFHDLATSDCGRFAMVTSTVVASPQAGDASYAAAKAAAETWTLAMAEGLQAAPNSSASIFVAKALVDEAMRRKHPDRDFLGYTDVEELASAAVGLFDRPAAAVNGQHIDLTATAPAQTAKPGNRSADP